MKFITDATYCLYIDNKITTIQFSEPFDCDTYSQFTEKDLLWDIIKDFCYITEKIHHIQHSRISNCLFKHYRNKDNYQIEITNSATTQDLSQFHEIFK